MKFGDKLKKARLALNMSQLELAEKMELTERSIYNYEQSSTFPKPALLNKLAETLNVTVRYLLDDEKINIQNKLDQETFFASAKKDYGSKGEREARDVISRAAALFAGGDLDDHAKEIFLQSIMEVYRESKDEAREKFSPKKRVSRKQKA